MNKFPFLVPENNFIYNLTLTLHIISKLSLSLRGKQVLNFDRLLAYSYLFRNPVILNKVVVMLEKGALDLSYEEENSIASFTTNINELYNRDKLRILVKHLILRKLITVEFDKSLGVLFNSSEAGVEVIESCNETYIKRLDEFALTLKKLQAVTVSKIEHAINGSLGK